MRQGGSICVAAMTVVTLSVTCYAQSPSDFYRGKTVEIYIGTSVGGGYDAYSRMLARHLGKYLPGNPTVVAKNMEGGGGMRLANFLYNAAASARPRSAHSIAAPLIRCSATAGPVRGHQVNWLGSTNNEVSVCVAWHTHGVASYQDVLDRGLVVGASGPAGHVPVPEDRQRGSQHQVQIVTGYPGGTISISRWSAARCRAVRLVLYQRQGDPSDLAATEADQHSVPDNSRQAP
jgi:hypothetical protein